MRAKVWEGLDGAGCTREEEEEEGGLEFVDIKGKNSSDALEGQTLASFQAFSWKQPAE